MYELEHQPEEDFPHAIIDENGLVIARVRVEADAQEIVAALNLMEQVAEQFPGLIDRETAISGSDLVELFNDTLEFSEGRYRPRI